MMVIASSRRVMPVPDSCSCFCMVMAGVGCFLPVLNGSGEFWPDLWINFSSCILILMLHDEYGQW